MTNLSVLSEKRKAGRPKKGSVDMLLQRSEYKLPEPGKLLHIEQGRKDGNKKLQTWDGKIISETTTGYLVKLDSGRNEMFQKNDFRFGQLIYQYVS